MRRAAWIVLAVMVVGASAVAFWPHDGHESEAAHVHRLASELRCVDCEGLSVADSSAASAREQRRDIGVRIRRGESDETIRNAYVDTFGENILLKPSSRGIGLVVWALPIGALLLGAVGLAFALRRWQRQPRLTASADDERFVAQHRSDAADE